MNMKTVLHDYDIYPKIIGTGNKTGITIRPLGQHAAFTEEPQRVTVVPMNGTLRNLPGAAYPEYAVAPENGLLTFTHHFQKEGEYMVVIGAENPVELHVYALDADLLPYRPYIGDLHLHSYHSDGHESPAVVAANYRKNGFDFMALTDHHKYEPSVEAIEAYADAPVDFFMMTGEEVHAPDNTSHYIHFGGTFSINSIFRENFDTYKNETADIERALDMPEDLKIYAHEYASSLWIYKKIREAGGGSVMAHPHWIHGHAYHKPFDLLVYELKEKPFDAFELIGGQPMYDNWQVYENQMQISTWQQVREDGHFVPPVGSSDSHGTVNCEYQYFKLGKTVVLSDKLEKDSIIEAIRHNRTVALEQYKNEKMPRCFGKHRYAAYVMFLLTEYFPLHDDLCYEEGRLMKEYACQPDGAGREKIKSRLAACKGQTDELRSKYWG